MRCRKLKICIVCGSWGDVSFIKPWDLIQSIQIHTERTSTMFSKSGCAALEFTGFFFSWATTGISGCGAGAEKIK